jgi:hypothetical protein
MSGLEGAYEQVNEFNKEPEGAEGNQEGKEAAEQAAAAEKAKAEDSASEQSASEKAKADEAIVADQAAAAVKAEEESAPEGKAQEGKPSESDKSVDVSELTGGKFKTMEELIEAANKPKSEIPSHIQTQIDLEAKGIKVTPELLNEISKDWKSYDTNEPKQAISMLKANMKLEHPEYDQDDIDFIVNEKYEYDEETRRDFLETKHSDEDKINEIIASEKQRLNKKLSLEAKGTLSNLQDYQSKLTVPEGNTEGESDKQVYYEDLAKTMEGLKSLSIKVGDSNVDIPISEEIAAKTTSIAESLVKDPNEFWKQVQNIEGFTQIIAKGLMTEEIIKEASARIGSENLEETVNEFTNQKSIRHQSGSSPKSDDEATQMAKQMGVLI